LKSHLLWVASYHSGDGWYLEQTYNYYTISLFIVYLTIWNRAFGDEFYPEIAATIEKSAHELMKTYTNFFGRDGYINMWARSICYRTWISGGFPVSFMLKGESPLNPGWARRLCSGSILQFVTREEFYHNDLPSLGFYGHKEFVLQNYSCPASPFLMFLPFICLALPDDSPFWTAKENEGIWEILGDQSEGCSGKPGLVLVNHGKTGTSEIISGKFITMTQLLETGTQYSFPWEDHNPDGALRWNIASQPRPRDVRGDSTSTSISPGWPCKMIRKGMSRSLHPKACSITASTKIFCTGRRSCASRRTTESDTSSIWLRSPSLAASSAWIVPDWPSNMN
jgi:hypothetical protein